MGLRSIFPINQTRDHYSSLAVRTRQDPAALLHRFSAWLVGGFAAMAPVLGVVGLYGVIACSVSQRTREIGVHMTLGAQRSSVYALVMLQAGQLTFAGLAIGLVCSAEASSLIRNLLFGVQAWEAVTLGCVAVLLGLTSMAASFLPARRGVSESNGCAASGVTVRTALSTSFQVHRKEASIFRVTGTRTL